MDLSPGAIEEAIASLEPRSRVREPGPTAAWGGWVLDDRNVTAPRPVRLKPQEAALLYVLMTAQGRVVRTGNITVGLDTTRAAMRGAVKTLRRAIGSAAVVTVAYGYRLAPVADAADDPVDGLIRGLELALDAAKRLRSSQRAGL